MSTLLCAAAAAVGWAAQRWAEPPAVETSLALVAYAAGGWEAARRSACALRRGRLDVDLLMLMAAAGAALIGYWLEGAVLLVLFSLGNTLETFAFRRTRRSIESLMWLRPDTAARLEEDGSESTVPVASLVPGMRVRVRPGERLPVDGVVTGGRSSVDESTLTGEPDPVRKEAASEVFAGTLNGSGTLDVEVTRAAGETTLARVIRLVEEAREARSPAQGWIERVEGRYAAAVILGAVLVTLIPALFLGWSWSDSLYRAMTLLVVASPCALVISIPITMVSAVANGARNGVLFKGGAALDALARVRAVAMDKTGTITVGHPELVGILALTAPVPVGAEGGVVNADSEPTSTEDQLLMRVAAVESFSEHHLARALVRAAVARGLELPLPEEFAAFPGKGVEGRVAGTRVSVGRGDWTEERVGAPIPEEEADWLRSTHPSATPVFVAVDGEHAGVLALADHPRPGVRDTLALLRRQGVTTVAMLTGDGPQTARTIADEVGVEQVIAGLLPEAKVRAVAALRAQCGGVAMVGDGVNDAPALAVADVGIAVGVAGTDVALETADVVLMGDDLTGLTHARSLSLHTLRVVRQNLWFATAVIVVLVALGLFGEIGLTTGVLGHEGSTVLVSLNGLRLLSGGR